MATYKVWLSVKDRYGNVKEVDGGNISIDADLAALTKEELGVIEEALPLEEFITKTEFDTELNDYATDEEVAEAVQKTNSIRYTDFELKD